MSRQIAALYFGVDGQHIEPLRTNKGQQVVIEIFAGNTGWPMASS